MRGASYLADRLKVDAGLPQFVLACVDLVAVDGPTQHISRFLPSVRCVRVGVSGRGVLIPGCWPVGQSCIAKCGPPSTHANLT